MAGLESIVRPFAKPDSLARRRIVAKAKVAISPAVISWGSGATQATAKQVEQVKIEGAFQVVHTERWKEVSRKSETVRITQKITNPDGTQTEVPENYVDVSRPRSVKFKRVKDPDEIVADSARQVYASTNIDSSGMAGEFVTLADRSIGREATYELSSDPTGARIPDQGQSAP